MKRLIILAMLVTATALVGFSQTATPQPGQAAPTKKSPVADYAGSWVGMFDGHPWITVRLTLQGTAMSGTVQRAQEFQFADSGMLKSVSQEQVTQAVETVALQGDGLLITVKDPNAQESTRYLMRLTAANAADLKMVAMSMPPGMPKPRPWKLSKVAASAVAPAGQPARQ